MRQGNGREQKGRKEKFENREGKKQNERINARRKSKSEEMTRKNRKTEKFGKRVKRKENETKSDFFQTLKPSRGKSSIKERFY